MSRAPPLQPHFAPGSGWYQAGQWTPSSDVARAEMRKAAIPFTVVVLYERGERVSAERLLRRDAPTGMLLCMDQYTHPNWHACLFADDMRQELLPKLMHCKLQRENGGVRLYAGIEFANNGRQEHRQAWLCAPTPKRATEILLEMLEREGGAV